MIVVQAYQFISNTSVLLCLAHHVITLLHSKLIAKWCEFSPNFSSSVGQMATLPASFSIRSCCINNGIAASLKPVPSLSHMFSQVAKVKGDKSDTSRKLIFGDTAQYARELSYRKLKLKTGALLTAPFSQAAEASTKYVFRTESGGQVKVSIRKTNMKYSVYIEVSSLHLGIPDDELVLFWGIYTSDSSSFIPLDSDSTTPNTRNNITETPLMLISPGKYEVELELQSYLAPSYLSFVLKSSLGTISDGSEIKSHRKANFCVPVGFDSGYSYPLGLSISSDGLMNFAFFSRSANGVCMCLYSDSKSEKPALEIELDPYVNKTGDIWHASISNLGDFMSYGYRIKGATPNELQTKVLLDPYAKVISESDHALPGLGELSKTPAFDWSGDAPPDITMEELMVYRLNVKQFTMDKSSKLPPKYAGTFAGVTDKLEHFKKLGVNAILLEPVFPFDEKKGPYHPSHFFSPVNLFGPSGDYKSAIIAMKEMVKKLHSNGIEVYLEVVFTHTANGTTLQESDYSSYYYVDGGTDLESRNSLNCNYPVVQQFILDSLRYWVTEFHVDGFCFINASYLLRGFHGEYLSRPPLVEAIAFDPFLSKTKIIADSWDPQDSTSKETIFPHWKRWAEINVKFCSDVRNFLRGNALLSDLATRLCGSGDVFSAGRGPAFSFNFISRNSGLSLVDLVSFSKDELASELSWNCGEEGPTNRKSVLERRLKQIRNFLFILYISLGVPVLNMGDEAGQSSGGSLEYGDRKPFNWSALNTAFGMQTTQFISFLCSLRKTRSDLLQKRSFLKEENINWHSKDLSLPRWDDPLTKFLAMTLKPEVIKEGHVKGDLYVAFNASENSENAVLPSPPEGMEWVRLVDTALPFPGFFSSDGEPVPEQMPGLVTCEVKSHSCVLFEAHKVLVQIASSVE